MVFVNIDDREEMDLGARDRRLARVLAPLRDVVQWYCDCSDRHGVGIADIILEPRGTS